MSEKFSVLHSHFIEGKGIKRIARESGLSQNTVRSYTREFAEQKAEIVAGGDKSAILLAMNEKPKYNSNNREKRVVTDDIVDIIRGCLAENERKKTLGQGKLCMKAIDIHEFLLEKGFKISYPSVVNTVRLLKDVKHEAFIRQSYSHGEVCEFDWGRVNLIIAGRATNFYMATFTLAASNIRYAYLYRSENSQAFIDAHIRFFAFMDAVPHCMVYDNMKVAVAKFVGRNERVATITLQQLSTYYGFAYRFCNICKGNEKGHVERSVEFVRRKSFAPMSEFDNVFAAQERLSNTLTRLNEDKSELFTLEQEAMLPKIPDYSSVVRTIGCVDKYSTIMHSQNRYSVPDHLVGKEVEVLAFVDEIAVKINSREVARHRRSYESHTFTLDITHYRETLSKKPGALRNSLCLQQADMALRIIYERFFTDDPKEFILMLELLNEHTIFELKTAIEALLESGARVRLDNIKMILANSLYLPEVADNDEIEAACEFQLSRYKEVTA